MPSSNNLEKIREEFYHFSEGVMRDKAHPTIQNAVVADWFLSKFSSLTEERIKTINGMGFKDPNEAGQFAMHSSGYNQAIEEVIEVLQKDLISNKEV